MVGSAPACARGRARSSRSRTQGEAFGGAKGEPEDADPAPISRVIRARGVVESAISGSGPRRGAACPTVRKDEMKIAPRDDPESGAAMTTRDARAARVAACTPHPPLKAQPAP